MISVRIARQLGRLTSRHRQYALGSYLVNRKFHQCCMAASDATLTTPQPSNVDKQFPLKIQSIVNDISKLTLLEVAELNQLLKKTLNIPDAPMMAMGTAVAAAPADKEEEQEPGAKAKSSFTVKLSKFDETKKIQLIKEVKTIMEGMNLVQAKKFVESVPQVVKADISKDDAEKLQKALEAAGGVAIIE